MSKEGQIVTVYAALFYWINSELHTGKKKESSYMQTAGEVCSSTACCDGYLLQTGNKTKKN